MDDSEYIDKIADSLTRTINALSTLANPVLALTTRVEALEALEAEKRSSISELTIDTQLPLPMDGNTAQEQAIPQGFVNEYC